MRVCGPACVWLQTVAVTGSGFAGGGSSELPVIETAKENDLPRGQNDQKPVREMRKNIVHKGPSRTKTPLLFFLLFSRFYYSLHRHE